MVHVLGWQARRALGGTDCRCQTTNERENGKEVAASGLQARARQCSARLQAFWSLARRVEKLAKRLTTSG